jgi:hypothetical protein
MATNLHRATARGGAPGRRRGVTALAALLLAGLMSVAGTPAAAATSERCGAGLAHRFAQNGWDGARQYLFQGSTEGLGGAWAYCQFRLYDDNDDEASPDAPEIPHVFSVDDWFVAGILFYVTRDELAQLGFDRRQGIDYLTPSLNRFAFGRSGQPLVDVPLQQTRFVDTVINPELGELLVTQHYHVFRAGSLLPGTYEWRWEVQFPGEAEPFVGSGVVRIVDA